MAPTVTNKKTLIYMIDIKLIKFFLDEREY